MNFNLVGSLLAVSSERGTVHVFRLGSGQGGGQGGVKAVGATASPSSSPTAGGGASSPPDSVDGTTQGLDGGYDAFIEKKKSASVSCVLFLPYYYYCPYAFTNSYWRLLALRCEESLCK